MNDGMSTNLVNTAEKFLGLINATDKPLPLATSEAVGKALNRIPNAIAEVGRCYQDSLNHINKHGDSVAAVIEAIDSVPDYLSGSRELKRGLREFLTEWCGFSKERISRLLKVHRKARELQTNRSAAYEWFQSLPISSRYELCCLDETGFCKAWAELSQWGEKEVSRDGLRALVRKHPLKEPPKKLRCATPAENSTIQGQPLRTPTLEDAPTDVVTVEVESLLISSDLISRSNDPNTRLLEDLEQLDPISLTADQQQRLSAAIERLSNQLLILH
jgi:hypothetical protein